MTIPPSPLGSTPRPQKSIKRRFILVARVTTSSTAPREFATQSGQMGDYLWSEFPSDAKRQRTALLQQVDRWLRQVRDITGVEPKDVAIRMELIERIAETVTTVTDNREHIADVFPGKDGSFE